jgi:hypothetical protein
MKTILDFLKSCWRAEFFSPRGFILRALFVGVAFLVVHLTGLRDYTSILNGTVGPGSANRELSVVLGVIYVAAYLGFVLLVPILLMAAGILAFWQRREVGERKHPTTPFE